MKIRGNTYKERTIYTSLLWVNGKPTHNHIDDECCADFSCCVPNCFTEDKEKRMKSHQLLLERLN